MERRPTLLEGLPPADPSTVPYGAIDRKTWEELAHPLGLPEEARIQLEWIVLDAKSDHARHSNAEQLGKSKKDLARMIGLFGKLIDGFEALGPGASSAVLIARSYEEGTEGKTLLERAGEQPFDLEIEVIQQFSDCFTQAVTVVEGWKGVAPADRALKTLIKRIDKLLIAVTGEGLARTSQLKNRPGPGRGEACSKFLGTLVHLALGAVPPGTIDDISKDVISERLSVGKS